MDNKGRWGRVQIISEKTHKTVRVKNHKTVRVKNHKTVRVKNTWEC